jgi:hypothetical protein
MLGPDLLAVSTVPSIGNFFRFVNRKFFIAWQKYSVVNALGKAWRGRGRRSVDGKGMGRGGPAPDDGQGLACAYIIVSTTGIPPGLNPKYTYKLNSHIVKYPRHPPPLSLALDHLPLELDPPPFAA